MKKVLFSVAIFFVMGAVVLGLFLTLAPHLLPDRLRQTFLDYVYFRMSEEEKRAVHLEISNNAGNYWRSVPEPLVARLAKPGTVAITKEAEVRINSAGMRSSTEYTRKKKNEFLIACLGDSFVLGYAGKEEDRFADQIEEFYRDKNITADGRPIRTYALGLDSWTAVQEATYLSSRISAYDPDVILVLTVPNDITDASGVTDGGLTTTAFSPEHRDWGSAFFSNLMGREFGFRSHTALTTDLSPEGRSRWEKAFGAFKRLAELQQRRGKQILFAVLATGDTYFADIYHYYGELFQIPPPALRTSQLTDIGSALPHDGHPSRAGHANLANHFIHAMNELEWVPVEQDVLPRLDERLSMNLSFNCNTDRLRRSQKRYVQQYLRPKLDFQKLDESNIRALLGGIFPDRRGEEAFSSPPWASVRCGFLLRRPKKEEADRVNVTIEIPDRVELFPLEIAMRLNGREAGVFRYEYGESVALVTMSALIPNADIEERVVEVLLETRSYFTGIRDHRMKSYRLLSAEVASSHSGTSPRKK